MLENICRSKVVYHDTALLRLFIISENSVTSNEKYVIMYMYVHKFIYMNITMNISVSEEKYERQCIL